MLSAFGYIDPKLDIATGVVISGKWLEKELSGYLSIQAKRSRVIYKIRDNVQTVEIHYVGHRKDIYELFKEAIAK